METFKTFEIFNNSSRDCLELSKKAEKHILKSFQQTRVYIISFRSIVSLSQKAVSTCQSKICKN